MNIFLTRVPRFTLIALLLLPAFLLIDMLCYQITLPVEITTQQGTITLTVGSTRLALGKFAQPQSLQFVSHDPLIHSYQIDGSDSVNNRDLDITYFRHIASSPYYRFQAWMRDFDGTSRWRDLTIATRGQTLMQSAWPGNGELVSLPASNNLQIRVQLQRPETPMTLNLQLRNGNTLQITLNRDSRQISVNETGQSMSTTVASAFFPVDIAPFVAMLVDTLARILLWSTLLLLAVQTCEAALNWGLARIRGSGGQQRKHDEHHHEQKEATALVRALYRRVIRLAGTLHPLAWLALGCSLIYVSWIALVEFHAQPHIYDASAYFFMAKTYASGHLFAPAPPSSVLFPGPFMVILHGRWFGQYEPGTALTLVPGIWLGVPWLVEPLLGTLALLGCGLIAARLYDRRVATLTILLGCLSPFYSYLAASYLSHTVALFYLVWGLWALLRFSQGKSGWHILLCGVCFGMAALTRDLVAILYIALLIPGVILLTWQKNMSKRTRLTRLVWWLFLVVLALLFSYAYMGYNLLLTGDLLTTPRNLFFSGDTWGFGQGIGFYGQHTLAAGFVNVDELLTSLQIDLFGWPFYLTLAFLAIPFLTGRVRKADWFLLLVLIITVGSYIGYFYNGIYLGPRYLSEDLPFLLILSARGILTLSAWGKEAGQRMSARLSHPGTLSADKTKPAFGLVTLILISALVLCNLLYYTPRQITRYQNYTGLPDLTRLDTSQIYHSPVHHAIVVTGDLAIYQMVLFPLNDPALNGDVIYAWGDTTAQFDELQHDFPGRALYLLVNYPDGSLRYIRLN